jgi:hypothetical protein
MYVLSYENWLIHRDDNNATREGGSDARVLSLH